jgi:hypothetical protein
MRLKALAINCTLKTDSGDKSSTDAMIAVLAEAFAEKGDHGRMPSYGKVAVAACYWVGEAMESTDFKDLKETPEMVTKTARMVASNAAHLAGLLQSSPYPG